MNNHQGLVLLIGFLLVIGFAALLSYLHDRAHGNEPREWHRDFREKFEDEDYW